MQNWAWGEHQVLKGGWPLGGDDDLVARWETQTSNTSTQIAFIKFPVGDLYKASDVFNECKFVDIGSMKRGSEPPDKETAVFYVNRRRTLKSMFWAHFLPLCLTLGRWWLNEWAHCASLHKPFNSSELWLPLLLNRTTIIMLILQNCQIKWGGLTSFS